MANFNPGDTVRLVNVSTTDAGSPNYLGGNSTPGTPGSSLATVQGQSFFNGQQFVYVKIHATGAIYQLPVANVVAAPGSTGALPLPGVSSGWAKPGHHTSAP
jgi:hypothetical protein